MHMTTRNIKIKHEKQLRVLGKKTQQNLHESAGGFDAWGAWIREHDIKGFLCILSSVCDNVPDEPSSASRRSFRSVPGECRASAPGKKFMCTTTWERTACLNINKVCLVTKHLSSGCSPAGAQQKSQGWGRSCSPNVLQCSRGSRIPTNRTREVHTFPHSGPNMRLKKEGGW